MDTGGHLACVCWSRSDRGRLLLKGYERKRSADWLPLMAEITDQSVLARGVPHPPIESNSEAGEFAVLTAALAWTDSFTSFTNMYMALVCLHYGWDSRADTFGKQHCQSEERVELDWETNKSKLNSSHGHPQNFFFQGGHHLKVTHAPPFFVELLLQGMREVQSLRQCQWVR